MRAAGRVVEANGVGGGARPVRERRADDIRGQRIELFEGNEDVLAALIARALPQRFDDCQGALRSAIRSVGIRAHWQLELAWIPCRLDRIGAH